MAVNIGTAPERWLRGVERLVASMANLLPRNATRARRGRRIPAHWVMQRGPARATAPVDALGGFPGSLRSRNALERTTVAVTSRYLVVGEGTNDGFALRMSDLLSADMVRPSLWSNPGLVVSFQDGAVTSTFALNFRGLARGLSGRYRAEEVLRVLQEQGVQRLGLHRLSGGPSLALPWEEVRVHENETLLWAGRARACVGGWYGAVQRSCRVWLTRTSLLWCCSDGEGVNRLSFSDIAGARDGVSDRIRVSFHQGDQQYDLLFDFDVPAPGLVGKEQRTR
ncbi:MAG TPA: hypothetical protein VGR29_13075, partial [Thermomicrobiales bacterium]|nr:hypothetical protein [Thermomicrobiales bacterium]